MRDSEYFLCALRGASKPVRHGHSRRRRRCCCKHTWKCRNTAQHSTATPSSHHGGVEFKGERRARLQPHVAKLLLLFRPLVHPLKPAR